MGSDAPPQGGSLPSGTVSFLFTDIEGSTRLLQALGERYGDVLATQRRLLRSAFAATGGTEIDTQGDAHFAVFFSSSDAVVAAVQAQRALAAHEWPDAAEVRVRMGVHTGQAVLTDEGYIGIDVHRGARIAAAAHGGQILVSSTVRDLVADGDAAGARSGDGVAEAIEFVDLGSVRLKDLEHAERLYQVRAPGLDTATPRPVSLDTPTNVPRASSALVGRTSEVAAVTDLLRAEDVRLVTITGTGGTGKTRIAQAAAHALVEHFRDGVFFVPLAAVSSSEAVAGAIAQTIGAKAVGHATAESTLTEHVRDGRVLLVLDNFEHLLDAAPLVARLLGSAPNLKVLATSRRPLRVSGERESLLLPLSLPPAEGRPDRDALLSSEAVQLFCQRAAGVRADFDPGSEDLAAIAEICRRLDGLPLAIELAAARVGVLSPRMLLTRLDRQLSLLSSQSPDAPERQRTLTATIEWSYDMLDADAQRCFRQLAAFPGGFSIDRAESVLEGRGTGVTDVLVGIEALLSNSLLIRSEDEDGYRFRMLQTVRDYALTRLADDPDASGLRRRFAAVYAAFAEEVEEQLNGSDQVAGLRLVDAEIDNFRAALGSALDDAAPQAAEVALRIAGALGRFWDMRSLPIDGVRWLDAALARREGADALVVAKALRALGVLLDRRADYDRAERVMEESLTLYRDAGDESAVAKQLNSLGVIALSKGDAAAARRLLNECLVLRRALGDRQGVAASLCNLGIVALDEGDDEEGERLLREALEIDRETGDDWGIAIDLGNLTSVTLSKGDVDGAERLLRETLGRFFELGDADGLAECLDLASGIASARERFLRAVRLAGAASRVRRDSGASSTPSNRRRVEAYLAGPRAALGAQMFDAAFEDGQNMTLDEGLAYALSEPRA